MPKYKYVSRDPTTKADIVSFIDPPTTGQTMLLAIDENALAVPVTLGGSLYIENGVIKSKVQRTFANGVSRALGAVFTAASGKDSNLRYRIPFAYSLTALLGATATVYLEYSTDGANWQEAFRDSVTYGALATGLSGTMNLQVHGHVPAGSSVRVRAGTVSGGTLGTPVGQEINL